MKINVELDMETIQRISLNYLIDQYESIVSQIPFPNTEAELSDTLIGYEIVLRDLMNPSEYRELIEKTNKRIDETTKNSRKPIKFVIGL
jgi:hypothetical protein